MPRSVPRLVLKERLHWASAGFIPRSLISLGSHVIAKNPRASAIGVMSITHAPGIRDGV